MKDYDIKFGEGSFVGPIMRHEEFFDMPLEDQARYVGRADGCPVVGELIADRGAEAMLRRYSEVNFWFGYIAREAEVHNPALHAELLSPMDRTKGELPGKFEGGAVPTAYLGQLYPMNKLPGYALPRVFIEQLGTSEGLDHEEVQNRLHAGLIILEEAITNSTDTYELLAKVAESVVNVDAKPEKVLKHILGKGWLEEHNAWSTIHKMKNILDVNAPTLWAHYANMTPEEREAAGLV